MNKPSPYKKSSIQSKILVGLLLFSLLTILSSGFLLKKGIRFDSFTIGPATLSDFSLQWTDKLELQINTVTIAKDTKKTSSPDLNSISGIIKTIQRWGSLFSKIAIKKFSAEELTGTIYFDQYAEQEPSFFTLTSKDFAFRSDLSMEMDILVISIKEATSKRFNSHATGQIRFNPQTEQLTGILSANLAGALPISLEFTADQQQISFQGQGTGNITTITPFVDLFGLEHNIQRWITDYLRGSSYTLKTFTGVLPWNKPQTILETLHAEVRVNECAYTISPGLAPIETDFTDVVFNGGVLTITPHNPFFYGQSAGDSWLDINFNDLANIILTAHIKTLAKANDDILTLLKSYGIPLPFKQTAGKTRTDLTLGINLNKLEVIASGIFVIDEGAIEYDLKNYDVTNARFILQDSTITIEHASIHFEELFYANITGIYKITDATGDLNITLEQFIFKSKFSTLTLNESKERPVIRYHIRPDGHSLDAEASSWELDATQLNLGAFRAPFSPSNLSGTLPPTLLNIPPGISAQISGSFSIKEKQINFHSDLFQYAEKDLLLEKSSVPVSIHFDQELTIQTEKTSYWRLNTIPTTLYPSKFKYKDNVLSIINGQISYGHFFDSKISGQYDKLLKQGNFLLEDLQIKEKNIGYLLGSNSGIPIEVYNQNDKLSIKVPELDLTISTGQNKSWSASFNDLAAIHRHSALLQKYLLDAGNLTISSENGKKPYSFSANIPYHYPFLIEDDKPVTHFNIVGEISDQELRATVNEGLQVQYSDHLVITSKDLGYNVPIILKFLKERPKPAVTASQKSKAFLCTIDANNSNLFFRPGNQILADRMHVEYVDGKTSMHLEHGQGNINLDIDIEGDTFSLAGQELNDIFMDALFQDATFQNGDMSLIANGSFHKFSTLIKINDTIIKDFSLLNNTLALINTVPALITFSLPEYNIKGLPINSAVVGMVIEEGIATFESFAINSPELNIIGNGWIDFPQKLINMDFNLITQAKANMNKIPLIGYILVGKEERPSITVQASGDLLNPEVKNSAFREVTALPFSILFRTLSLPAHLLDPKTNVTEERENEENSEPPPLQSPEQESFHEN